MNTGIYEMISYISFGLSALMLLCTILLFWKLRIPSVIGELTGKTARKAIEELRNSESVYSRGIYGGKRGLHYNELAAKAKSQRHTEKISSKTESLNQTEKLWDAQIEDDTRLLEEFPSIPVRQQDAGFEITKDEIYVHENKTELLKE